MATERPYEGKAPDLSGYSTRSSGSDRAGGSDRASDGSSNRPSDRSSNKFDNAMRQGTTVIEKLASWRGVGWMALACLGVGAPVLVFLVFDMVYAPTHRGLPYFGFTFTVETLLMAVASAGGLFGLSAWLRGREVASAESSKPGL